MPAKSDPRPEGRNIALLALSQALFMSVQSMGIATTPLAAYTLLDADHKWLATVPVFLVHVGLMSCTVPASLIMAVIGRRLGFSLGALAGVGRHLGLHNYLHKPASECGYLMLQEINTTANNGRFSLRPPSPGA